MGCIYSRCHANLALRTTPRRVLSAAPVVAPCTCCACAKSASSSYLFPQTERQALALGVSRVLFFTIVLYMLLKLSARRGVCLISFGQQPCACIVRRTRLPPMQLWPLFLLAAVPAIPINIDSTVQVLRRIISTARLAIATSIVPSVLPTKKPIVVSAICFALMETASPDINIHTTTCTSGIPKLFASMQCWAFPRGEFIHGRRLNLMECGRVA